MDSHNPFARWHARVAQLREKKAAHAIWVPTWLKLHLENDVEECRHAGEDEVCKKDICFKAIDVLARRYFAGRVTEDEVSRSQLPGERGGAFHRKQTTISVTREVKVELDYFAPKLALLLGCPMPPWSVLALALQLRRDELGQPVPMESLHPTGAPAGSEEAERS